MVTKNSKIGIIGIFLSILILTACASQLYVLKGEESKSFTITGTDYDEAFSKAVRTATEIGLSIFTSDKNTGTFYASRGTGFGELTEMNFFLEKETQGKLTFIVKVKSSKGSENVINEFVSAYGKYVKVIP